MLGGTVEDIWRYVKVPIGVRSYTTETCLKSFVHIIYPALIKDGIRPVIYSVRPPIS